MTEPSPPRPGPSRPGPGPGSATASPPPEAERAGQNPFDDLGELPVGEHVAVFEAEHSRLQRELGTIDQL
jgi:hypothetical protein